jgi:murein L,D-transpeptidase YafK
MQKIYSFIAGIFLLGGLILFISQIGFCRRSPVISNTTPIPTSTATSLKDILKEKNIRPQDLHIEVSKKQYTLKVLCGKTIIKSYPVVLGPNPVDDKRMEGDGCTPEGSFRIQSMYPHNKWSKFMWLNYPTNESYRKHHQAKKEGEIPSNARIGGEVGIHGVKKGQDFLIKMGVNWTKGCISLQNDHIDELYDVIPANTEVIIYK